MGKKQRSRNITVTWNVVKKLISGIKSSLHQVDYENISNRAEELNDFFADVGGVTYQKTQEGLNEIIADTDMGDASQTLDCNANNFF